MLMCFKFISLEVFRIRKLFIGYNYTEIIFNKQLFFMSGTSPSIPLQKEREAGQ